jgi:hypothetical protein
VSIGDRFRFGTAELVVTQPRLPSLKLGIRMGRDEFVAAGGLWALAADEVAGRPFTSAFDPWVGVDGLSGLFLDGTRAVCSAGRSAVVGFCIRAGGTWDHARSQR